MADAAEIVGRVTNATTGQPVPGQSVNLLALRGQMVPIRETQTNSEGRYRFVVAANPNERFLVQVPFRGVNYNRPAMFAEGGRITADVEVFETGASPADVQLDSHIIFLEPHRGHLRLNEFYSFANRSRPPRTFAPDAGSARFALPAAASDLQVAAGRAGGMPLRQQPQSTERENTFVVHFPLYPGESEVQVSYVVPISEDSASLRLPLSRPAARRHLAVPREGVELMSPHLKEMPAATEVPHARIFEVTLAAPADLELKLRIDPAALEAARALAAPAAEAAPAAAETTVSIIPHPVNRAQWYILGLTLFVLLMGLVYLYSLRPAEHRADAATREPRPPARGH
ncbi:MAG: carboxypeptidase regulatory-like domain-containing protein [Acidobacteria bacterium]|nr:carboxypeptidase regulatory-like domain-containing protein [Acidobacteriota bacterium]